TLSSSGGFAPPPASAAAESDKKADITRLPARAPTDMVTKMPASTIAGFPQTAARSAKVAPAQEKEESSAENDTAMAVMAPPEPAGSPIPSAGLANRKLIRNASVDLEVVKFDE